MAPGQPRLLGQRGGGDHRTGAAEGHLPAPIYAPGFPYEGTLKPHLTALLGLALPGAGTPFLYVLASHLFYLLWVTR